MKGNSILENVGSFNVIWTGDGSPSLRGDTEPMHHLGGAYAETQYIYGEALRRLQQWPALTEWRVLVVGLGLGYIELLAMAEALKHGKPLKILSYEIKQELVDAFLAWLQGDLQLMVYDKMYEFFQKDYYENACENDIGKDIGKDYETGGFANGQQPKPLDLKLALWQAYQSGDWQIRGRLDDGSLPTISYQALLFDAFSGKSTPELWSEEFLARFLGATVNETAIFSTYACTGTLRRTLQTAGFIVEKRLGFQGKRNATIATFGGTQAPTC
jgi:hypothetical protein